MGWLLELARTPPIPQSGGLGLHPCTSILLARYDSPSHRSCLGLLVTGSSFLPYHTFPRFIDEGTASGGIAAAHAVSTARLAYITREQL